MLKQNPATGQMEDDYGPEPVGSMVVQQEHNAATMPTFIDDGSSAPPPPPVIPVDPVPDDVMPPAPDNGPPMDPEILPPLPDNPAPIIGDDLAPTTLASNVGAPDLALPAAMPIVKMPDDAIEPVTAKAPTLTDERIDAAKREGEVKAEVARVEANRAQADLDQKIAGQDEENKIISQSEQRVADRRQMRDSEYQKYKDMTVQDAWGDNGTAKRVLAGLAMILGGRLGAAVVIGAAQGLEEKKRTELALQEKVMAQAGRSLEEIKDQTADDMAAFKNRQAAAFGVTAARLEQEKRAQGIPEAKIATDQEILKIKAEEEKSKIAAKKLAIDAENDHLKAELTKAQTRQANAHADKYARDASKKPGAGGGKPVSELVGMKERGASDSEITQRAEVLGLKPKDYLPSIANVVKTVEKGRKESNDRDVGNVYDQQGNVIGNVSTGDVTADRQRGEKVRLAGEIYLQVRSNIKELQESLDKEGYTLPTIGGVGTPVASKRESLHSDILTGLKEIKKLGVLAGPDMGIMTSSIGGVGTTGVGVDTGKLRTATKTLDRGYAKQLGTFGLNGEEIAAKQRGDEQTKPAAPAGAAKPNDVETKRTENAPTKLSSGQKTEAKQWLDANPNDPDAPAVREKLRRAAGL